MKFSVDHLIKWWVPLMLFSLIVVWIGRVKDFTWFPIDHLCYSIFIPKTMGDDLQGILRFFLNGFCVNIPTHIRGFFRSISVSNSDAWICNGNKYFPLLYINIGCLGQLCFTIGIKRIDQFNEKRSFCQTIHPWIF